MNQTKLFLLLFILATLTMVLAVIKLIMGIIAKVKTSGHIENRLPLSLIIVAVADLIGAYSNINLFYAGKLLSLPLFKDMELVDLQTVVNCIQIAASVLSFIGAYMIYDYCDKKYGGHLRRLGIIFFFSRAATSVLLRVIAVEVFKLVSESTLVLYSAVISLPVVFDVILTVIMLVTFLRNRSKEETYKSVYIFYILSLVRIVISSVLSVLSNDRAFPAFVLFPAMFILGLLWFAFAVYVFICARNARFDEMPPVDT